jgi:hypothetical protein
MDTREGVEVVEMGLKDREDLLDYCERVFCVGELVEFWAGPVVRAYRTDSGDPAYVKEIQGAGWYGVKMLGSFGGRLKRVHWKSLYKDGTFIKQVAKTAGSRVRTSGRMMEKATMQAEENFGEELRQSKRELHQAGKQTKEKAKEVEDKWKRQEIVARTAERDREKAEGERIEMHKRQVVELGKDHAQDMEDTNREARQTVRELRQELKLQAEELRVAIETEVTLREQVSKEQRQTEKQRRACETWRGRHKNLVEQQLGDGERVRELEREVKGKTREVSTLQRKVDTNMSDQGEEIRRMVQERDLKEQVSPLLLLVPNLGTNCFCPFPRKGKRLK